MSSSKGIRRLKCSKIYPSGSQFLFARSNQIHEGTSKVRLTVFASHFFQLLRCLNYSSIHAPKGCQRGLVCSRNQLKIRNALHQCPLKLSVPSFKLDPFRKNKAVVVTLKSSADCLLVQNETLETSRYQKTGSISNVRYTLPSLVQDTRYTLLRFVQDSKVQFPEYITILRISKPRDLNLIFRLKESII